MIKQILSKDVKDYIKNNPKCVLLDVRSEEEWEVDGRPDGDKIGLKTYFLSISETFIEEFKNLNINKENEILTICKVGGRSQMASELLSREDYTSSNISDGFSGNELNFGWKASNLPCK